MISGAGLKKKLLMSSTSFSMCFLYSVSAPSSGHVTVCYIVHVLVSVSYDINTQNFMSPLRGTVFEKHAALVSLLKGSVKHGFFDQNSTTHGKDLDMA